MSDEKHSVDEHPVHAIDTRGLDVAAAYDRDEPLSIEDALRIRRKIDWHLMPLMCILYLCNFADKTALGQSAILGIFPGAHLNQNQFNWLGTIFYLAFLIFQYPQNLALQRFPVGKWMTINIFIWSIALMCHSACHSFGGLFACRFILGACEGAITPGFLIVTSMFYTREEQTRRIGYWYLMNGFAIVFLGLVSFGLLHIKSTAFLPWQWLMIITGLLTLIVAVVFWFAFPDSPTSAWFLTQEERSMAVRRIKANQAGIENKTWKPEQFMETLKDPKTWLFALFAALSNLFNSLTNQRQIIVHQFGFSLYNTTLLGTVDGAVEVLFIYGGVALATQKKIGRAYAALIVFIPGILGQILVNTLSSNKHVGLLLSYYLAVASICAFIIFLGWVAPTTAGHTKRISTNAIVMVGYCIGNIAGPFMWKPQYQPRNHTPWTIITVASVISAMLLLVIRYILAKENKRRDLEQRENSNTESYVYVPDGIGEKKVHKAFLDLTDRQNKEFRYIL
jgi:ACS family allantoate permease-like MFS transporter